MEQDSPAHLEGVLRKFKILSVIIEAHHVFAACFTCCLVSSLAMIMLSHRPCATGLCLYSQLALIPS